MVKVFISYSSLDKEIALKLADDLRSNNHSPWIDQHGIAGGDKWPTTIVQGIRDCDYIVLLMSPNSLKSDNVRKELHISVDENKSIIPIKIAPIEKIPDDFRYHLAGLQHIDFVGNYNDGFLKLESRFTVSDTPDDMQVRASLIVDTRSWTDFGGQLIFFFDEVADVDDFLLEIYFSMSPEEPESYTFGEIWALRDKYSGKVFTNLGSQWRAAQGIKVDNRSLEDVGFRSGMLLEIIRLDTE